MNKWIAEFELEDGDTMPEHMDLNYMGTKIDFYCRPLKQEPKTEWIPVSERLPEETGWYLITIKTYGGGYTVNHLCYRKPENYWTDKDISKKVFDNSEVTAWMPLPKPYKVESEVDNGNVD